MAFLLILTLQIASAKLSVDIAGDDGICDEQGSCDSHGERSRLELLPKVSRKLEQWL